MRGKAARPLLERVEAGIDRTPGPDACHPWTQGTDSDGYAKLTTGSRSDGTRTQQRVSRIVLERKLGRPLLLGMLACHTCDNPVCCNEAHIYEGTFADNARDAKERQRHPGRRKTHCHKNHEFTPDNTIWRPNGTRACRTCHNARRRKAAAN